MRAERERAALPTVALVGYTNAGKSTLLNALTGADVSVRDRLFNTLDPTVRTLRLSGRQYLLSDTVGFIRKLPHQLVDAFGATLEETRRADLLAHVIDASVPEDEMEAMTRSVGETLDEIGAGEQPRVLVLNKVDLLDEDAREDLRTHHPDAVLVSGGIGIGLEELGERIERELAHTLRSVELLVPYANGGSLAELHEVAGEIARQDTPEGVRVRALVPVARLISEPPYSVINSLAFPGACPRPTSAVDGHVLPAHSPAPSNVRSRPSTRQTLTEFMTHRTLAIVSVARQDASLLAGEQLVEVRLGDVVEVEAELARDLGDVPEHVAELLGHRCAAGLGDGAAVVADRLLGVLGHLTRLAGQAERGVGEPRLARVLGRAAGQALIFGELHEGILRLAPRRRFPGTMHGLSETEFGLLSQP